MRKRVVKNVPLIITAGTKLGECGELDIVKFVHSLILAPALLPFTPGSSSLWPVSNTTQGLFTWRWGTPCR